MLQSWIIAKFCSNIFQNEFFLLKISIKIQWELIQEISLRGASGKSLVELKLLKISSSKLLKEVCCFHPKVLIRISLLLTKTISGWKHVVDYYRVGVPTLFGRLPASMPRATHCVISLQHVLLCEILVFYFIVLIIL